MLICEVVSDNRTWLLFFEQVLSFGESIAGHFLLLTTFMDLRRLCFPHLNFNFQPHTQPRHTLWLFQFIRALQSFNVIIEYLIVALMSMHTLNYIIRQYIFLLMIKQSFLRNYNIGKILNQAEDQKKRLQVFYIRSVNRLIRQKHHQNREILKNKLKLKNKEEKLILHLEIKNNQNLKENNVKLRTKEQKEKKRELTEESEKQEKQKKNKVDLFISNLQLAPTHSGQHFEDNSASPKRKKTLGKTFYQKFYSTTLTLRPGNQLPCLKADLNSTQPQLKKEKFPTNPSFYDHFDTIKLKEDKAKEPRITILEAVCKRLRRQKEAGKKLKKEINENQTHQNDIFNGTFSTSMLSSLTPLSPKISPSSFKLKCKQSK